MIDTVAGFAFLSRKTRKWLDKIRDPILNNKNYKEVYEKHRVCARHFFLEDILQGCRKGIRYNAVPQLFIEGSEETTESSTHQEQPLEQAEHRMTPITIEQEKSSASTLQIMTCGTPSETAKDVINVPSTPTAAPKRNSRQSSNIGKPGRRNNLKEINVTRQKQLTPKTKKLYKKVIDSSNSLGRLSRKITSFKKRLAVADQLAHSKNFVTLLNHVNSLTYTFILCQVRTQHQKAKAKRFTMEEKLLALTLLKATGKGYRLLAKIFSLPSRQTLTSLLNKIPLQPGIKKQVFDSLEAVVKKMKPIDRCAILLFDEMSIDAHVSYNSREDEIKGIQDFGLVFMLKGIFRQWKQPISYTFSGGPTKSDSLKQFISEIISECQRIGLKIFVTVCDQGGPNQAAINKLIHDTKEQCLRNKEENRYFGFLVNQQEIIPLFDTPHLFKGLRNNLLTKDLHFHHEGKPSIAKWNHIEQFYLLDTQEEDIRVCPKLTDSHVIRGKISIMKVKCCTQLFIHLMKKIVAWKSEVKLDPGAIDTANLILFLDKLFDSLNSSKKFSIPGKPLKAAVTSDSSHITFWYDSIKFLQTMKLFCPKEQTFVMVPSIKNLIHTLRGFIYICENIFKLYNNKYILTRVIQQDSLEIFFSCIRGYSGRENSPSATHFQTSFKPLLTNNFMSRHSPGANCEEDDCDGPLDNLRVFLVQADLAGVRAFDSPVEVDNVDIPSQVVLSRRSKLAKCTINYISGYIVKKTPKKIDCINCKKTCVLGTTI